MERICVCVKERARAQENMRERREGRREIWLFLRLVVVHMYMNYQSFNACNDNLHLLSISSINKASDRASERERASEKKNNHHHTYKRYVIETSRQYTNYSIKVTYFIKDLFFIGNKTLIGNVSMKGE